MEDLSVGRQSKFPVKNDRDSLMRKIRSLLNRVSSLNFLEFRHRWLAYVLPMEEAELQEALRILIFKGLEDSIYMNIYAQLLGYLLSKVKTSRRAKIQSFVSGTLHRELVKLGTDRQLASFHQAYDQLAIVKNRHVAIHRFLAELYNSKVLTFSFIKSRIHNLLFFSGEISSSNNDASRVTHMIEEHLECLSIFLTFAGRNLFANKRNWLENTFLHMMSKANETASLSNRTKFMLQDLEELKEKDWHQPHKWWAPAVTLSDDDGSSDDSEEEDEDEDEEAVDNALLLASAHVGPYRRRRNHSTQGIVNHEETSGEQRRRQPGTAISHRVPQSALKILMILNKVTYRTEALMTKKLQSEILEFAKKNELELATQIIVDKISAEISDAFIQLYATMICKVKGEFAERFYTLLCQRLLDVVKLNPAKTPAIRLLSELFMLDMISGDQVKTTFEVIVSKKTALQDERTTLALIKFLTDSGDKLEKSAGKYWMDKMFAVLEENAFEMSGRIKFSVADLNELRQKQISIHTN